MRALRLVVAYSLLSIISCSGLAASPDTPAESSVTLVFERGRSNYEIVIAGNAVEGITEAAKELQRLIEKSTGAALPISRSDTKGRKHIYVGVSAQTKKKEISDDGLALDAYRIRVDGDNIYLVGKDDARLGFYTLNNNQSASAGSYYAVIDFARRFLGARWYMPGALGEEVSQLDRLDIPSNLDVVGVPRFAMRYIDIAATKSRQYQEALVKQGYLSNIYYDQSIADDASRWGRHLRLGSNIALRVEHAWYQWLPADQPSAFSAKAYGRSNPEYYSIPGGKSSKYYYGKDNSHGGQLCICNPDVATEFANNIISYAKKTGQRSFSLSPNDGDWECSCSCCRKNSSRYRPGTPELTAETIAFANRVVGRVVSEIPDARFGFYAYDWTLAAPLDEHARPEIDISDVHNGLAYRYSVPAEKARSEAAIKQWRDGVDSIVLTTYYTFYGHYSLPWSTLDVHSWLFDLFRRNKASSGLRMNYALLDAPPVGMLGADPWVLSELLWDPDQPIGVLKNQFYEGAFGVEAGKLIRTYFDLIDDSMKKTIAELPYRDANGVRSYIAPAYAPIRAQCRQLIDGAVLAVSNSDERFRWRVSRIARAWRLTEITLDLLAAEKEGNRPRVSALVKERQAFLADKDSLMSLAPASADHQNIISPLLGTADQIQ